MSKASQIFQSANSSRWTRFKWSFRVFLFLIPIIASILGIGLYFTNKNLPGIPLEGSAIKKVLSESVPNYRESNLEKEYKGFRKAISKKWKTGNGCGQELNPINLSSSNLFSDSLGIRAAFYVNWDAPQSLTSLERNISKLNLVIPEWLFIDPNTDRLYNTIDPKALKIMQKAGVKIMPLLSNNYFGVFRGDAVNRILTNPVKRQQLITDLINIIHEYQFVGVNIDFEDLTNATDEPLVAFQKLLYEQMHAQGLLVSQDVIPFNEDYNYKALAKYNDYLILMAYDQHHAETKPGPNSSQKWIEAAVDKMIDQVPANKIILAMAAFGHNWKMNGKKVTMVTDVTYQQAMASASNSGAKIEFDNDSYNLNFEYYDSENKIHQVYFVDAATNFNTLRFATELNLAGTALWRLGGEDLRLWDFYNKPMTKTALQNFDFIKFNKIKAGIAPDFEGEGEILDIVASPKDGLIRTEVDKESYLISEEYYDALPSTYVIRRFGATNKRKIVLTFDDGPDPKYTKEILDTLAYYHVPASFFLVGYQIENNIPLVKRIFKEGHEIGNHTFTHPDMSLVGNQRASIEMDATRLLIECITGHSTILFRAPFNADSEPGKYEELAPIALSRKKNYISVGESIDPNDWRKEYQESEVSDTIFKRVVEIYQKKIHNQDPEDTTISGSIILLHDAGGNRTNTVKATGMIIRYFQSKGYIFTTVADLLGKKPDDIMPPVAQGKQFYWLQFNYILAESGYLGGNLFFALFLVFLILSSMRLIFIGVAAMLEKKKRKLHLKAGTIYPTPLVSIIVPAYNEEVNAVSSIDNLLKCNYPDFEIIFVDDGSTDNTYEKVKAAFENIKAVKIFTKQNGGKASALNYGVGQSNADFVVCIDADTKLAYDAVSMLMRNFYLSTEHLENEKVGAVAGAVKVGNEVNILTKWQNIEYITSQNFDRKGFAYMNAITVIPGAIGAFRRDAVLSSGGFTTDTLAEDCDITIRILKEGYKVINEPMAHAFTEVPEHMSQFMKQRVRWSFGVLQTFWKHKDALFNVNYKSLGFIALPDMLLFRYIIPFFMPFADLLMLMGFITGNGAKIGVYFLIFVIVDALIAGVSFAFEKENPAKLVWLIPQRLIYRWIMMVVFFKAIRRAIKGELQVWGVLKRTGNVKDLI